MIYDFSFVLSYWDVLLKGLLVTIAFTSLAGLVGALCGFGMCLARVSRSAGVRWFAAAYVNLFRGTPLLIQLFWIYFCLPVLVGKDLPPYVCVFVSLVLYTTAITSETFRGAIKSIPPEQHDACVALNLSWSSKIIFVIFPQTLLRAAPSLLSNMVSLFKESALISSVGVADLMFAGQSLSNATARPVEFLTTVAVIYFLVAFPLTHFASKLEKHYLARMA